jgi:hypothetical protein
MLIDELIEKAFSDGYEYALKEKIFFLSPDGHAFTADDIYREKAEAMLKSGPLQNNTKLAYKNTAAALDQSKAWDSAKRELRRKGVEEGDALYNELRRRTSNTAENSFKELNRRVNKISKPNKFKNFIKNIGKRIGKRI